jgi:hypothetical protein
MPTSVQMPPVERSQSRTRGAIKSGRRPIRAAQSGVTKAGTIVLSQAKNSAMRAPISLIDGS